VTHIGIEGAVIFGEAAEEYLATLADDAKEREIGFGEYEEAKS
jgi:hypothetical protein